MHSTTEENKQRTLKTPYPNQPKTSCIYLENEQNFF